jgi:hypothetical protein
MSGGVVVNMKTNTATAATHNSVGAIRNNVVLPVCLASISRWLAAVVYAAQSALFKVVGALKLSMRIEFLWCRQSGRSSGQRRDLMRKE